MDTYGQLHYQSNLVQDYVHAALSWCVAIFI